MRRIGTVCCAFPGMGFPSYQIGWLIYRLKSFVWHRQISQDNDHVICVSIGQTSLPRRTTYTLPLERANIPSNSSFVVSVENLLYE